VHDSAQLAAVAAAVGGHDPLHLDVVLGKARERVREELHRTGLDRRYDRGAMTVREICGYVAR
jgi:hypothetical protein